MTKRIFTYVGLTALLYVIGYFSYSFTTWTLINPFYWLIHFGSISPFKRLALGALFIVYISLIVTIEKLEHEESD